MPPFKQLSVSQYYKGFKYLGIATALFATLPLFSNILPDTAQGYAFPPLGDVETFGRGAVFVLVLVATFVVFLCRNFSEKTKNKTVVFLWILAVVCCIGYLAAATRFIRTVPIPSTGKSVSVSVGYERTDFASSLGQVSDIDLLRMRSPEEEEIQKLWTFGSLIWARIALWTSYCLLLSAIAAIFGFGALQQAENRP